MSISPVGSSESAASTSSSRRLSMATPLEPYQSAAFQSMRSRMQSLSALHDSSFSTAPQQLSLSAAATEPPPRQCSVTPSPPVSESSSRDSTAASRSRSPITLASDSSASSCTDVDPFQRHTTVSPTLSSRVPLARPSLASKRLLSEGDVVLPRPAKKTRMANHLALRNRSLGVPSSGDNKSSSSSSMSSVTSWRAARDLQRQRRLVRRSKAQAATPKSEADAVASASSTTHASTPANAAQVDSKRLDPLPELRLLSATRTAPIGWSQLPGSKAFKPDMVEVYDERDAERAPERQRFWPIVDHQLDYTGARMLSLSHTQRFGGYVDTSTEGKLLSEQCQPVSPKSSSLPLARYDMIAFPAYTRPMGSSNDGFSPLTPDAPVQRGTQSSPGRVYRWARAVVETESQRRARIPLSPSATLSAVIDFTRAQASVAEQQQQQQQQQSSPKSTQLPARNAYGQLIYSPPSLQAHDKGGSEPKLSADAPLRIAPRRHSASSSSRNTRNRDYFGHWESYLCNYGKESTF